MSEPRPIRRWTRRGLVCALFLSCSAAPPISTAARADDWPGYLGPARSGRSLETGIFDRWPEDGPEVLWRIPLGSGYSSVAVSEGRAITLFADGGDEWVGAFDAGSGKLLWRTPIGPIWRGPEGGTPRSTPYVEGDRVWAMSATAHLACLDAATGAVLWTLDLEKEYKARSPEWGIATSPIVDGDLLLVQGGGGRGRAFLAFDKNDGSLVWSSGNEVPGYASPIVATIEGVRQAIFFMADGLVGVAVADGTELWTAPWRTRFDVNAATPIFVPASGFVISSGYNTGAMLVQVVKEGDDFHAYQIWRNRVLNNHYNTSVRVGGYLYGFDEVAFKCVDVLSGDEAWKGRAGSKGSLAYADGHLFVLSGDGELNLVAATPDAFESRGEVRLTHQRTWAAPSLSDGVLYVRAWNELIAVRVGEGVTASRTPG